MRNYFQIEIPKRSNTCSLGQEPLEPGMEYHSLLQDEGEELVRKDFCSACWGKLEQEATAGIHWKSKVPPGKEDDQKLNLQRDEMAFHLFREALKSEEESAREEAFVLSLYLARKRMMYLRQEVNKEGRIMQLYEVAGTEEMILVPKVQLSELQTEKVQRILAAKFKQK